ncbi:MAG TPA: MauE/DoxX family redox-associated membrane protein [Actinomycetospora sp.]|nr:MauE/DoxX family redox-associated membrane protein [Actinomycetospora sp.]
MILLAVLVVAFAISYLVLRHGRHRDAARWAMAVAMVFAGVSHFLDPDSFVRMLPGFVPYPSAVIFGTGVIEILLGVGLLVPRRRRRQIALALIAYLIVVFPANVYAAVAAVPLEELGGGNPWLRLPIQAVYIAWVLWAVPGVSEPLRAVGRRRRDPTRNENDAIAH